MHPEAPEHCPHCKAPLLDNGTHNFFLWLGVEAGFWVLLVLATVAPLAWWIRALLVLLLVGGFVWMRRTARERNAGRCPDCGKPYGGEPEAGQAEAGNTSP